MCFSCTKPSMAFTYVFYFPPASRRYVRSTWNYNARGHFSWRIRFSMHYFLNFWKKNEKWKIVSFVTSHIFFWGGVSQFCAKRLRFFSFSTFYPSPKGRRELKIRTPGVIFHGESDFRWIIFSNFWKYSKVENRIFFELRTSFRKGCKSVWGKRLTFFEFDFFFYILYHEKP